MITVSLALWLASAVNVSWLIWLAARASTQVSERARGSQHGDHSHDQLKD